MRLSLSLSWLSEKGIFLTTGTFTAGAQREAIRDGVAPIQLVDGSRLVSLMEQLQIGVKPRVFYDVDVRFFDAFRLDGSADAKS